MARLRGHSGLTDRGLVRGASAPSGAAIGQMWFNTGTGVLYQRTANADGSSFWLDISSSGISTSTEGVDFVGDIDPHISSATTGDGLAVGSIYFNREKNKYFVCTTASNGANAWKGIFQASGGVITDYLLSGTKYRVHTFLGSGTFHVIEAVTVDYLCIAGGGGGSSDGNTTGGAGGGAGGMLTSSGTSGGGASAGSALSMAADTTYTIKIGDGGFGGTSRLPDGRNGRNSSISGTTITDVVATGGGRGGYSQGQPGAAGGSGGGGNYNAAGGTASTSPVQGYNGGAATSGGAGNPGGGGGGAGGVGKAETPSNGGDGGEALVNSLRTGAPVYYAGGGGGGVYGSGNSSIGLGGNHATNKGGGGDGGQVNTTTHGGHGTPNTGGGGGGTSIATNVHGPSGGKGGSGIVVLRYTIT